MKNSILRLICSKRFVLTFAALFAVLSPISFASSATQDNGGFLSMTILDSKMDVSEYFSNNSTVALGDRMSWYIKVHNGMNTPEYLTIKVKLLNSTQVSPDDLSNKPSPYPAVFEYHKLVATNDTIIVPMEWSILDIENHDGQINIKKLMINGQEFENLNAHGIRTQDFRMVIELWRYDVTSGELEFEWSSSQNKRSVWNQIWFNVKN
jgi:hypothetical protein